MKLDEIIKEALREDLQDIGDVTSSAIFSDEFDNFFLQSKSAGILGGISIFKKVFHTLDPQIKIDLIFYDGDKIEEKDIIATISGKVHLILKAERIALNLLSHLSGIASKTAEFVYETGGRSTILDTRKTLPIYRELQKYAVRCGGGANHRMGLYDMVMIKDNHSDAAGGISEAIKKVRQKWDDKFQIEVETRNLEEVKIALDNGADRIMLDNMSNQEIRKAVKLIKGKTEVEVSGNMTLDRIASVAKIGVDFISVGELTHTVKNFDFSLKREKQ